MTTVFVRIEPIVNQTFPSGTVGGNWSIWVTAREAPTVRLREYSGTAPSTNFQLEDGQYTAWGVRLDAQDNPIGSVQQEDFDVSPETVNLDVAGGVAVLIGE